MSNFVVVDASLAFKWLVEEENFDATISLGGGRLCSLTTAGCRMVHRTKQDVYAMQWN